MFDPTLNLRCPELFQTGVIVDVNIYIGILEEHYSWLGSKHMKDFYLTELVILKESTSQHEYLHAKASSPKRGFLYLVIEHLSGEWPSMPIATNTPLHSQSKTSLSLPCITHFLWNKILCASLASQATAISSSTISSTHLSQKTHEAQDIVSFLCSMKWALDDKECNQLSLGHSSSSAPTSSSLSAPASLSLSAPASSSAPTSSSVSASSSQELHLYSLIIIVTTIHRHYVWYKVLSENCYFLARSIFHLVEKMYGSAQIDSKASSSSWHSVQLFLSKGGVFDPKHL